MIAKLFRPASLSEISKPPLGGLRFDWAMTAGCAMFLGGLFVDGWAHQHGKTDNTFFTPWHAIFYSGFLVVAGVLLAGVTTNRRRGHSLRQSIPPGYLLSLVGAGVFAVGGVGDMIWHSLFGVEASTEALLSPTHLLLALGITLIVSGPLRAAWHRPDPAEGNWIFRFATAIPLLLSLAFTWSLLTFMTQFIHPMVNPWASTAIYNLYARVNTNLYTYLAQALGVATFLAQTGLLMGVVLIPIRRWSLPFGSFTVIFAVNAFLMSFMDDQFRLIAAAVASGLITDLALVVLKRFDGQLPAFRLFAFGVPTIYYGLYFLALALTDGIWWSIHLWAGSIVITGIEGLLLSYVSIGPSYNIHVESPQVELQNKEISEYMSADSSRPDRLQMPSRKILRYRRRAETRHSIRA